MAEPALLTDILKGVSRSFYLTLRVLPGAIRPSIGLAYLLARATDTVADTEIIPVEERLEALDQLRGRIQGNTSAPLKLDRFIEQEPGQDGSGKLAPDAVLLMRVNEAIELLHSCDPGDQQRIRHVLEIITSGQELDLKRFELNRCGDEAGVRFLSTDAELDDYTYRVAGCVGEFWTRMCCAKLKGTFNESFLLEKGVRFGKGLQLVNILRDLPRDLKQGRCYLPSQRLQEYGLSPVDLASPDNEARLRPLYNQYLDLAGGYLRDGWDYTNALPGGYPSVRFACAWPVLIGVQTLSRLRREKFLDPAHRVKISRANVRSILFSTLITYWFRNAWNRQFEKYYR